RPARDTPVAMIVRPWGRWVRVAISRRAEAFHALSPQDEALQLAQRFQPQFHSTEALGLLELGLRAEDHAQRHFGAPVLILERGPGVGMFRPVLAPKKRVADPLLGADLPVSMMVR